jgi:alpha-galactosidase
VGVPSLADLVARIRDRGRRAGIWVAPFLVGRETALAQEHPDWLVGDAGRNWGQALLGLDLTHPDVRDYLAESVRSLVDLGVDYFKLDFVYGGALPGRRHEDVSPVAAYRSGLRLIREAAGEDAYLVGCGAPVLPSVGLLDAMRVSPDTFHEGGEDGSHGLRGRPSLVSRAWQQGRFWVNDSDCLVARPSYAQRERWAETVATFGGLRSCSDRLRELDDWGLATTRAVLEAAPGPEPFRREVVAVARDEAE